MLPRMTAATVAPSAAAAASPWRATGGRARPPAAAWPIGIPACRAAAVGALARLGELTADGRPGRAGRRRPRRPPACRRRRDARAGQGLAFARCPPRSPPPSRIRIPSSSSALRGSPASAGIGPPCRRWSPSRPPTTTPAAARGRSPRSAPSATRPGSTPCSMRSPTSPTVRRRATVALAGFDDPRVETGPAPVGRATATGRCARRPRSCSDSDTVAADPPSGPSRPR